MHQADILDLQKQLQNKESRKATEDIRMKEQSDLQKEVAKSKHQTDMADLQVEEDSIVDKEIPELLKEISAIQNDFIVTEQRYLNIKSEKEQIVDLVKEYLKMIEHAKSLKKVLNWQKDEENANMEGF